MPEKVKNLRISDLTDSEVTLEWDAPLNHGVDQYFIDFKKEEDENYIPAGRIDGKKTKFVCSFLEKKQGYNFRLRPKNAAGFSKEFTTLEQPVSLAPVKSNI